ncbi:hypothetical protein TWF730_010686 [Orbilia blumenaviensis]|uniref:NACHT domain-containing protein n=1 Tax=Orbilia blumenaviensis TaxID=1796055 RepID=A0AAV9USD4_9PEZI
MATKKNRGTYRATNIGFDVSEAEFKSALLDKLTSEEKEIYTISLRLAPTCTDPKTQIAIIRLKPFDSPLFFRGNDNPSFTHRGRDIHIDSDFFGLTQLYTVEPKEIKIDVVALSGLNSHAYGSWVGLRDQVGPEINGDNPMWLQDFFSQDDDLKSCCRTMIFGFNTKYGAKASWRIEDYVRYLLTEINKARGSSEEQRRPIALIGHSLGGNIITQAFLKASEGDRYENIYKSVKRIFLFGVPFRGIHLDDVASVLEDEYESGDQGLRVVQDIINETDRHTTLTDRFKYEIKRMAINICTFYETDKTREFIKGGDNRGPGRYGEYVTVVDRNSAELGISGFEEVLPADGDHSTIVKLKSMQDTTYRTIHNRIMDTLRSHRDDINMANTLDEQELEKIPCVESAAFDFYSSKFQSRNHGPGARCHPKTRIELLQKIKQWAKDPQGTRILWLNGMAGAGKSTISRTIAQTFDDGDDDYQLGASFFFDRNENGRNNLSQFFTTIAFQLVQRIPSIVPHIKSAIKQKPQIARGSLEQQFEILILQPLKLLTRIPRPLVFVIDALDECGGGRDADDEVAQVFDFLHEMGNLGTVHIKIFLASRPELAIRQGFDRMPSGTYDSMTLHDHNDIPEPTVKQDISVFLRNEFSKIVSDFNLGGCKFSSAPKLPLDWPGDEKIRSLVKLAIPSFIFAATISRFVGDTTEWDPERKLNTFLKYGSAGGKSRLNRTYLPVIKQLEFDSNIPEPDIKKFRQEFREIIGSIIVFADPLPASSLARLLGRDQRQIDNKLHHLHSVLDIPSDPNLPIRLLHLSFREFLVDPSGKGSDFWFCVDEKDTHSKIMTKCLDLLPQYLKENICSLDYPGMPREEVEKVKIDQCIPKHVQYACHYWPHHLKHGNVDKPIIDEGVVHEFLRKHFLHWLEILSLIGQMSESLSLIDTLHSLVDENKGPEILNFLSDSKRFLLQFWQIADKAPLQIYSSAIVFSPEASIIRNTFPIPKWVQGLPDVLQLTQSWGAELQKLEAHTSAVTTVLFSPNGKQLASGSADGTVRLWDVATGQQLKSFEGHNTTILKIAFLPEDNQLRLVSVSDDGKVILWDVTTKQQVKIFETDLRVKDLDWYAPVAFSSDGKQMAAVTEQFMTLWNTRTGEQTKKFEAGDHKWISAVAFSPNNKTLALAISRLTYNTVIELWEIETWEGKRVKMNTKYTPDLATAITFSSDSKYLASVAGPNICLWDVTTGQPLKDFPVLPSRPYSIAILSSPNSKYLASKMSRNLIIVWKQIGNKWEMGTFQLNTGEIRALAFSPNGERLVSASGDKTIRIWDTTSMQQPKWHTKLYKLYRLILSQNQALSEGATIWGETRTKLTTFFKSKFLVIMPFAYRLIALCDVVAQEIHSSFASPKDNIMDKVVFSPDRKHLVSISDDRTIKVRNLAKYLHCPVKTLRGHKYDVTGVAFSKDGKQLASASSDEIILWDTENWRSFVVVDISGHHIDLYPILSPALDSQKILMRIATDVVLWNKATNQGIYFKGHQEHILAAILSPDGKYLVSSSRDNTVRLWNAETGQQIKRLKLGTSPRKLQFSSESGYIETDRGTLAISPDSIQLSGRPNDIFFTGEWIALGGRNFLWLPQEHRNHPSASQGSRSPWASPKILNRFHIFDSIVLTIFFSVFFSAVFIQVPDISLLNLCFGFLSVFGVLGICLTLFLVLLPFGAFGNVSNT